MHSSRPWIVIPTYNEKTNITQMIPALYHQGINNLSVVIVDDNSPDGTSHAVKTLQAKFPQLHVIDRPKKDGLGKAYMAGFSYALSRHASAIVQMDADFSHDPADVPRLLSALTDADVIIGSRYAQGISVINWPLHRLLLSIAGNTYARLVTGLPIKDATGGFKAWRAAALQAADVPAIKASGYGFQIATSYHAWKKGYRLKEIPIIFTERRNGQSKMNQNIVREALILVWKLRMFG